MSPKIRLSSLLLLISAPAFAQPAQPSAASLPAAPAAPAAPTFKPGVLLQAWYLYDDVAPVENTFRIRRAEISAKGEIVAKRFAYAVMFDPARLLEFQDKALSVSPAAPMMPGSVTAKQPVGATSILQDLFVTVVTPVADVSLGQFKIPVSYEGYNSSSKLLFPERSLVSSRFGDKREAGLRIAKQFTFVGYSLGLFNGSGVNTTDSNESKDGALRLEVYPIKGLLLAGVAYASLTDRQRPGAKDRYEADVRFERGPALLQAEYIYGRDVTAGSAGSITKTRGYGLYVAAGARILEELQLAVRYGHLNPSRAIQNDHRNAYEGLINYHLRQFEARLQLSFSHFRSGDASKPAQNVLILAAQAAY